MKKELPSNCPHCGELVNYLNYKHHLYMYCIDEKTSNIIDGVEKNKSVYFLVHSVKALQNKDFSIFYANIANTPNKIEIAKSLYPIEDWHFEFHNYKIDISPVIK